MRRGDRMLLGVFVCALVLLAGGVVRLFVLRFRLGDIYPPYSSLRTDPIGTKALYESLAAMKGLSAERNLIALDKLVGRRGMATVFVGLDPDQDSRVPSDVGRKLGGLAVSGSRVIVGFLPVMLRDAFDPQVSMVPGTGGGRPPSNPMQGEAFFDMPCWRDLLDEWEVRMEFSRPRFDRIGGRFVPFEAELAAEYEDRGLPERLPIRTGLHFVPDAAGQWRVVYSVEDRAVALERQYGEGSIVLLAEAYPLSNEGLYLERKSEFLGWLLGGVDHVVFDETHLGIEEIPGLMNLVRKYGLQAAVASLGLLAILFVWTSAVPVVPRHDSQDEAEHVARRESRNLSDGMVNLLRRAIQPHELMEVCLAQWKRTLRAAPPALLARIQAADAAARVSRDAGRFRSDPAGCYREISDILNRRGGNP